MSTHVRFAPSPTGHLHVGNARTALVNWIFSRNRNGRFLLRLDDTDLDRSTGAYADAIRTDLRWLGLQWDHEVRQSDRLDRYSEIADRLRADGRLYPCFETHDELALKRKSLRNRGLPPIYDRAALSLTDSQRRTLEQMGRQPHWRFRLFPDTIAWTDLIRGPIRIKGVDLSDPILIREDGQPLYTLCSVVDDGDFEMSHVLRGEDHITNTAVQLQLFDALKYPPPTFGHLSLLTDTAGQGLSKRLGSLSLADLRNDFGFEPMAVNSYLAKLGTSEPIEPYPFLPDLVATFTIQSFSRATPRFDFNELQRLNHRLLLALPFEAVAPRLKALGLSDLDPAFWKTIRPNLTVLADARDWWEVLRQQVQPLIADPAFTNAAADLLSPEPWDETTWKSWTNEISKRTGAKGKALFLPLRRALTGRDHGPDLKSLFLLLGRARAVARLRGKPA